MSEVTEAAVAEVVGALVRAIVVCVVGEVRVKVKFWKF